MGGVPRLLEERPRGARLNLVEAANDVKLLKARAFLRG